MTPGALGWDPNPAVHRRLHQTGGHRHQRRDGLGGAELQALAAEPLAGARAVRVRVRAVSG